MAESQRNRVKASKIRAKRADKVTAAERAWLAAYESRKSGATIAKAKAVKREASRPAPAPVVVAASQFTEDAPAYVHTTQPVEGAVAADASTWIPTVPEGVEGEVTPTGVPPPPAAGSPLVDAPAAAVAAPGADPAAVEQLQMLVVGLCMVGIQSGQELLAGRPDVPPMVLAALSDPAKQMKGLAVVSGAAGRLAVKYELKSIPMADEVIVGGACVASAMAWFAVQKRKKGKPATSPTTDVATSPIIADVSADVAERSQPSAPSVNVSDLTGDGR